MFHFGDPQETAKIFWENALRVQGPKVPDLPYDEMEEQDLRNVFTYLYMSAQEALNQGASEEVMAILIDQYDEVFQALAEASESFRNVVRYNQHVYVGGYSKENIKKYKQLAGVA